MKKLGFAIAGTALLGSLAWLALATRGSQASSMVPTEAPVADHANTTIEPARPAQAKPPTLANEPARQPVPAKTTEQVREIYKRAIDRAAPCYRDRPAERRFKPADPGHPDETMQQLRVEYKLEVKAGKARVREVRRLEIEQDHNEPFDPNVQDMQMARCVVGVLGTLSWATTEPDGELTVVEDISIGDLDRTATAPPSKPTPDPRRVSLGTLR